MTNRLQKSEEGPGSRLVRPTASDSEKQISKWPKLRERHMLVLLATCLISLALSLCFSKTNNSRAIAIGLWVFQASFTILAAGRYEDWKKIEACASSLAHAGILLSICMICRTEF